MVPVEYNTNGKGIMAVMKYILIIYSPNWKCMVLWKIIFEIGNGHGEREKKMQRERYNVNQSYFYALPEKDKGNVTSWFRGI